MGFIGNVKGFLKNEPNQAKPKMFFFSDEVVSAGSSDGFFPLAKVAFTEKAKRKSYLMKWVSLENVSGFCEDFTDQVGKLLWKSQKVGLLKNRFIRWKKSIYWALLEHFQKSG